MQTRSGKLCNNVYNKRKVKHDRAMDIFDNIKLAVVKDIKTIIKQYCFLPKIHYELLKEYTRRVSYIKDTTYLNLSRHHPCWKINHRNLTESDRFRDIHKFKFKAEPTQSAIQVPRRYFYSSGNR